MFRVIAILFVCSLLTFTGGYVKGHWDADMKHQADKKEEVVAVVEVQDELDTESHAITGQWLETDNQREVITKIIEVEVIKYVPQIQNAPSVCNLSVGGECMLNARRANRLPEIECGSLTDAEKQTASEITEAALIEADIQSADQYAELAGRCDALIDVVESYQQRIARMRTGDNG